MASRLGRQSARPYRAAGAWVLPRALHDRIAELKGHICRGQARATYLLLHAASNSFTALSVASSAMQRARRTILDHKNFCEDARAVAQSVSAKGRSTSCAVAATSVSFADAPTQHVARHSILNRAEPPAHG